GRRGRPARGGDGNLGVVAGSRAGTEDGRPGPRGGDERAQLGPGCAPATWSLRAFAVNATAWALERATPSSEPHTPSRGAESAHADPRSPPPTPALRVTSAPTGVGRRRPRRSRMPPDQVEVRRTAPRHSRPPFRRSEEGRRAPSGSQ